MRNQGYDGERLKSWLLFALIELLLLLLFVVSYGTIKNLVLPLPIELTGLLNWHFSWKLLFAGLPLYVFGIILQVNTANKLKVEDPDFWYYKPKEVLAEDIIKSIFAGTFEELGRWSWLGAFLILIIAFSNSGFWNGLLLFGNLITAGLVNILVVQRFGVAFGLAIILDGLIFATAHLPKPWITAIFIMYFGIFLGYTMITCGLFMAVFIHVFYDIVLAITEYWQK